jgi:hypothetical protein
VQVLAHAKPQLRLAPRRHWAALPSPDRPINSRWALGISAFDKENVLKVEFAMPFGHCSRLHDTSEAIMMAVRDLGTDDECGHALPGVYQL